MYIESVQTCAASGFGVFFQNQAYVVFSTCGLLELVWTAENTQGVVNMQTLYLGTDKEVWCVSFRLSIQHFRSKSCDRIERTTVNVSLLCFWRGLSEITLQHCSFK